MYEILAPLMTTENMVMFKASSMLPALVLITMMFYCACKEV